MFCSRGAALRRWEARYTPLLLHPRFLLFQHDERVWIRAAENIFQYKNIHPFEMVEDRVSFKLYLNQPAKT